MSQISAEDRKRAYINKMHAELAGLARQGIVMSGNAFSSVLLLKGDLSVEERGGVPLLSGEDGEALRRGLIALGYVPGDWSALSVLSDDYVSSLDPLLLREAVCALDPVTLLTLDDRASQSLQGAYADELSCIKDINVAKLRPGLVAHVLGMRFMNLGGFAEALKDSQRKQFVWACLKRVPPLKEPY
jgi:hypothetical protein